MQQAAKMVHDNVYDNVMYMQNLYFAHSDNGSGFVVKPSELLSLIDPESLANVTKKSVMPPIVWFIAAPVGYGLF